MNASINWMALALASTLPMTLTEMVLLSSSVVGYRIILDPDCVAIFVVTLDSLREMPSELDTMISSLAMRIGEPRPLTAPLPPLPSEAAEGEEGEGEAQSISSMEIPLQFLDEKLAKLKRSRIILSAILTFL